MEQVPGRSHPQDEIPVRRNGNVVPGIRASLSHGKRLARPPIQQLDGALRQPPPVIGLKGAFHCRRRVGGHRGGQDERMKVQLAFDGPAEEARFPVRCDHQSALVLRGIQGISQVDRGLPLAIGPAFGHEQVQPAHAHVAIRGEVQMAAIRMQEGTHFLSRRVDPIRQASWSGEGPVGLDARLVQVMLAPAGSTSAPGEIQGPAIWTEAGLALPIAAVHGPEIDGSLPPPLGGSAGDIQVAAAFVTAFPWPVRFPAHREAQGAAIAGQGGRALVVGCVQPPKWDRFLPLSVLEQGNEQVLLACGKPMVGHPPGEHEPLSGQPQAREVFVLRGRHGKWQGLWIDLFGVGQRVLHEFGIGQHPVNPRCIRSFHHAGNGEHGQHGHPHFLRV